MLVRSYVLAKKSGGTTRWRYVPADRFFSLSSSVCLVLLLTVFLSIGTQKKYRAAIKITTKSQPSREIENRFRFLCGEQTHGNRQLHLHQWEKIGVLLYRFNSFMLYRQCLIAFDLCYLFFRSFALGSLCIRSFQSVFMPILLLFRLTQIHN